MSQQRPPRIKFCGITRVEDAQHAVSLDAWAVGLNLWAGSPRCVLPQEAADIADAVRRKTEIVGVFVNEAMDAVVTLAEMIGLTMVQLHGDEGNTYAQTIAKRTGCKVIKAVRVKGNEDIQAAEAYRTDFHLLDSYVPGMPGGTGRTFAWELLSGRRSRIPLILSGGLNVDNVAEAIELVHPFAVDVASGVESEPGIKDHDLMTAFAAVVSPPVEEIDELDGDSIDAAAEESAR